MRSSEAVLSKLAEKGSSCLKIGGSFPADSCDSFLSFHQLSRSIEGTSGAAVFWLSTVVPLVSDHGRSHYLSRWEGARPGSSPSVWSPKAPWTNVSSHGRDWSLDSGDVRYVRRHYRWGQSHYEDTDQWWYKAWCQWSGTRVITHLVWLQFGRLAVLCKSISPLGVPRWKKILPRCPRFQEMIMRSSGSSWWGNILTCSCHLIVNLIVNWWSGSSVISWFMVRCLFIKLESSGPAVNRSCRSLGSPRQRTTWSKSLQLISQFKRPVKLKY